MVTVLIYSAKTRDYTSFCGQAITHQNKLNSYFRALQLDADSDSLYISNAYFADEWNEENVGKQFAVMFSIIAGPCTVVMSTPSCPAVLCKI